MNSRSKDSFDNFLKNNQGIVFKVCQTYCQSSQEREDLAQEIIIQLWKAFPKFNPKFKASTWTYRIALNVAISNHRKAIKRKEFPVNWEESLVSYKEEKVEENPRLQLLYEMIYELNELNRAIMLLYLEDYNYDEIAEICGLSKTNVASKINRIKNQLRKKVAQTATPNK